MKLRLALLGLPILLLLPQCSSGPSDGASVPILSSPSRAQAWGRPKSEPTSRGYKLTYKNPSNSKERLTIEGSRSAFYHLLYPPNLIGTRTINGVSTEVNEPQVWQQALVANQRVNWYQRTLPNKDHGSIFRTLGEHLKNSDGVRASYRIEVEGSKNQMQRWLSEVEEKAELGQPRPRCSLRA